MSIAEPYRRTHSFTGHQAANPDLPHSGVALDREFDVSAETLRQIIESVSEIQQDDGRLKPELVYLRNLAPEVFDFIVRLYGGEYIVVDVDGDGGGTGTPGPGSTISGVGILRLIQALDFPNDYRGHGGKMLRVKLGEDGVEFVPLVFPEVRVQDATDVESFEDKPLFFMRVNAAANGVELIELPIDPDGSYARLDSANEFAGNLQENMGMGRYTEKLVALGNVSGIVDLNPTQGNVFECVATGNLTFQLTALPPAGRVFSLSIRIHSPAQTTVQVSAGDWGYRTRQVWDAEDEVFNEVVEARPAPTLPAGSYNMISLIAFPDGRITARF